MKSTTKGYFAIALQSVIIGLSYLFVKIALTGADAFDLLAHRFTAAAAAVILVQCVRPRPLHMKKSDFARLSPLSLAYPILFFLFQTLGLESMNSAEAGIIYSLIPILTLLTAGLVLGESIGNAQKILMALSVAGVVFINAMNGLGAGGTRTFSVLGALLILLSAVCSALYNVFTRKLTGSYSAYSITFVMTITAFLVFNAVALLRHAAKGTVGQYFAPFVQPSFLTAILYLGVLSSLVSSLLSTYALAKLEASTVGQFNNFATVVSIAAGVLLLKEPLFYYHFIGISAILVGTIGFNCLKRGANNALPDRSI